MKILLFGRNGQVGGELQRSLAPLGEVVALGSSGADGLAGDFADPQGVARTVRELRPDVVVNAAAYTAVDKAESESDKAQQVNAVTPGAVAEACKAVGAWTIHYSSDYVFDGSGTRPWREDDPTGPLNVYGRSKLAGEQRIVAANPRHLVLRTSWVYAARGGNFIATMLRLARERETLTVVDDQVGAPTGAALIADVTAQALPLLLAGRAPAGIYHLAAAGETSWHGYARFVLQQAAEAGVALRAGPDRVQPVPSSAFVTAARRPHNSRLDTSRFRAAFGLELPSWEAGVRSVLPALLEAPR
jgi:dTDP-4-dehydrorhamnose reductase